MISTCPDCGGKFGFPFTSQCVSQEPYSECPRNKNAPPHGHITCDTCKGTGRVGDDVEKILPEEMNRRNESYRTNFVAYRKKKGWIK